MPLEVDPQAVTAANTGSNKISFFMVNP